MPAASSSRPATIGALTPSRAITRGATHDHHDHDRDGHRQQRRAALEGAVAEHLLEVEVQEEPHRDPRRAEQQLRDVRRGQVRRAEDAQPHQRLAPLRLDRHEHGEQQRGRRRCVSSVAAEPQPSSGARTTPNTVSARPAVAVSAPRDVDRAAARRRRRHQAGRDGEHEQRDRDVDVEDPRPARSTR